MRVVVEGEGEWEFPDDATDGEISVAINRERGLGPRGVPEFAGRPAASEPATRGPLLAAAPPPPPGFVLDEDPAAAPAPLVPDHPERSTALPPPSNPLRAALLARRNAAGGAPLGSLGPEAVQAAGAAEAPPLPRTEGPSALEGVPQALTAGAVDVARSAAAMPRVSARLGEGIADAVLGEAASAIVRKLGAIAPQRVVGDFLEEKVLRPATEALEGGEAAGRDSREAPLAEKLKEPGWAVRQGLRQVPQLAASLGSAGAANVSRVARLAAPFVMEAGETARDLEDEERRTGEKIDNLRFGLAVAGKGAVGSALELAGAEAILGRLAKAAPEAIRKRIGKAAAELITGSVGEGLTERAQNLVGNFAQLMAAEAPTMRELFARARTGEFWEGLDRGGTESQFLGSLLGTGAGAVRAAGHQADVRNRAGRIAEIRAQGPQEAPAPSPAPSPFPVDVEGRRNVPEATVDAINEGVRQLLRPETSVRAHESQERPEAPSRDDQSERRPVPPRTSPVERLANADALAGALEATDAREAPVRAAREALLEEERTAERERLLTAPAAALDAVIERSVPAPNPTHSDTPTRARETDAALETPEEADRLFLEGLGLTPEQAREVGARMPTTDDVTGYATARHHGPTLERAQAWAERTGRPAQYVEVDVHNLGGMNAALGHSGADRVIRRMTDALRSAFPEEAGRRPAFIRHGGDELSIVAAGYTEAEVAERMAGAEAEVARVVRESGLAEIPHAKGTNDETGRERRRGAGIFWGSAPIEPGVPLARTREVADFAVEARKFTRRAEDVDRKQAVPSRNPSGPRPGGDAAPDPRGGEGGTGSAPTGAAGERAEAPARGARGALPGAEPRGVEGTAGDTPYARGRGAETQRIRTLLRAEEPDAASGREPESGRNRTLPRAGEPDAASGRDAFRRRFGADAPGLDRFLSLVELVRQEATDAAPEEAHEAALTLLEEERRLERLAPRGAAVDARAGAPDPRNAGRRRAPAEGTRREARAAADAGAPRPVARSFSRPPDPASRGISLRDLSAAVAKAEGAWPAGPEIAVIRNETELPLEVQRAIGSAKVRGVFYGGRHGAPGAGTVFLLADRVDSLAEAFETLAHEVVGHAGVVAALGPRGWKAAVREILDSRHGRALVEEWRSERGAEYDFDLSTESGAEGAVGETLAWIAERTLADPAYTPPTIYRRLVARVRAALRGLARRFGISPDALAWNEKDVSALIARAARAFEGPASQKDGEMGTWLSVKPEDSAGEAAPVLSEAQRRRVEEIVSRTRARLAEGDPRWRRVAEDLARGEPGLEAEPEGNRTHPDTPTRARGTARPDLANPGMEPQGRRLVDEVDRARTEDGEPARRADAEVNAEADRRLEADWEGERRALLDRGRQGAGLNDVETVTAKKIVSAEAFAAMKAGDVETLAETAELIDAYRRTGAEQARAFRQRRDEVRSPRERLAAILAEAVLRPGDATAEKIRTGTPAQRREALKRHGEQAKAVLEKLRERGVDVAALTDEDLADRFIVASVVREVAAARADLSDKVFEYWANSILSGPLTHIANLTGNTVSLAIEYGLQQPLEMALGSAAGGSRSLAEGKALYGALWRGVVRGSRNAVEAFQTEQRALGEAGDPLAPDRLEARVAIGGKPGRVVRIPYRFLRAADEFYRGVIGEMEAAATAHGIARKEGLSGEDLERRMTALLEDGESDAWQAASDRADLLTFQSELGRFGRLVLSARRQVPGLRYIIPFVTTPANIFKTALRKSPAGAIGSLWRASRGELSKDEAIRTGAEQLIGLGVVALLAQGIGGGEDEEEPWITGTVPFRGSRKGERDLAERTAPPLSVRIGGKWYGYGRLEPLATWLGITVDGLRGAKEARAGKDLDAVIGDTLKRFVGQLEDKTFLDGLGRIIRAIEDNRSAARVAGDVAGGFVPALLRQPAQAREGKVRESRAWGAGPSPKHEGERYESRLARRIAERAAPFAFEGTPRVNAYGLEVEKPNRSFLGRLLSPVQRLDPSRLPEDVREIDAAFARWNKSHPEAPFYPPIPEPRYTSGGRTHYLTDEEYRRLLLRTGFIARRDLRELIARSDGDLDEKDIGHARSIFRKAAKTARESLKGRDAAGLEDLEADPERG